MAAFSASIRQFADLAGTRVDTIRKEIAVELLRRVVTRSPVGNPTIWKHPVKDYVGGRFRANWNAGTAASVGHTTDQVDASGTRTISAGIANIRSVSPDNQSIWISNSLPYAVPLENGWSQQAPAGMVAVTVAEFPQIVRDIINTYRNQS